MIGKRTKSGWLAAQNPNLPTEFEGLHIPIGDLKTVAVAASIFTNSAKTHQKERRTKSFLVFISNQKPIKKKPNSSMNTKIKSESKDDWTSNIKMIPFNYLKQSNTGGKKIVIQRWAGFNVLVVVRTRGRGLWRADFTVTH